MIFLVLFLLVLPSAAAAGPDVAIVIDGRTVTVPPGDQPAFIKEGRTYVPLRVTGENLGAKVDWAPETKQVIISTTGGTAVPPVWSGSAGGVQIVVDGEIKDFPADYGKPFITNGRTVVPFRAVGEALGCRVHWNTTTRTVEIYSAPKPAPEPPSPPEKETPPVDKPPAGALLRELAAFESNLKLLDGRVVNSADLLDYTESDFSAAQRQQFENYLAELKRYGRTITLPNGTTVASADLTITGRAMASAGQLATWAALESRRVGSGPAWPAGLADRAAGGGSLSSGFLEDLAKLYLEIGAEYGIRGDLAFAQAAKETRYWTFGGLVEPDQNNYCGLWATGAAFTGEESLNGCDPRLVTLEPGRHGATFASPEAGVEAHIQHLYAYATTDPLPPGKALLSPRFQYVSRGCAPTWHGLNARWAVPGPTYGQSIIQDYWLNALRGGR